MSRGSERLCGEYGRSDDGSRPNREAAGAVWAGAGGDGGRSRHADPAADRQAQATFWFGMDHGADEHGDSRAAEAGGLATVVLGREESGRDHGVGLSRRAADGVSQPGAGGAAQAETAGLTGSHGEEFGEDQPGSDAAKEEAIHGRGDWCEGGEGAGTLQNGQAL